MTQGLPQPLATAAMVVDADCPRRIARSASFGTGRLFVLFMLGALPAAVAATLARHLQTSTHDSISDLAATVVVAVVVFVLITGLALLVIEKTLLPKVTQMYSRFLPPGSTLKLDYYPDRMIATSAGDVVRETRYDTIQRVRVTRKAVVFNRGLGAGVLPIEVVPAAAQQLLRSGARPTGRSGS